MERPIIRHAIEVDCRLDVLADVLNLRLNHKASRRTIVNTITQLLPTLREHAGQLDDSNDVAGPLPAGIANEVRLLTL